MTIAQSRPSSIRLEIEAVLQPNNLSDPTCLRNDILAWLQKLSRIPASPGPMHGAPFDQIASLAIVDIQRDSTRQQPPHYLPFEVTFDVRVFALDTCPPQDGEGDDDGDDTCPPFRCWNLPHASFQGLWEALHYDIELKSRLLHYIDSAVLFSDRKVDPHLVTFGRTCLLHGPPGTGKTTLCQALAHKLSIRLNTRYKYAELIEISAHSLFSKWFSESGKLVARIFTHIRDRLDDPNALVFILIDEVESLAASRGGSGSTGNQASSAEPSDQLRAVNALLTSLDQLRSYPNAMVLTTSNCTHAIDNAFLDRMDIKAFVGLPTLHARYEILGSSMKALAEAGIVQFPPFLSFEQAACMRNERAAAAAANDDDDGDDTRLMLHTSMQLDDQGCTRKLSAGLLAIALAAEGLSGRALRKLPFLAHARGNLGNMESRVGSSWKCNGDVFMTAMEAALDDERSDRSALVRLD